MAIGSAKGTLQKIGDGASPEVFTTIGQVRSISGPSVSVTVQDVTTHSTAGNWMEKLATLIDPGTISFPINYDAEDATHAFATGMWSDLIALTERNFQTVLSGSAGELEYAAFVTGHAFDLPVDNVRQVTIELTITGEISTTQT